MNSMDRYHQWLASDAVDAAAKAELLSIANDPAEIEERFYTELTFGTAGLRGVIGAGTNRMNAYVVRRATQGLSQYVCGLPDGAERGVCIAYDSRHCSAEFARETACVLAGNGVRAYLFATLHSVPQLSFTMQQLGCAAGVVITASHNPAKYNGYKVYAAYGGQAAPEAAAAIYENIQRTPMFGARRADFDAAQASGLIRSVGEAEDEAYYRACEGLLLRPEALRAEGASLSLVYTPLHGSGYVPVTQLLARAGLSRVSVVPEQALPDPAFSTVSAPNPEDPAAFTLAIRLAEETGAAVCLATDPDADRLGVAVRTAAGTWVTLTGNQIGSLLCEHILSSHAARGTLPQNGVVIKSLVSTRLADRICARYGVACEDVLTGFRFIAERIDAYARSAEKTFLFGFEESYGYLAGGLARDKDGILAAALVAEMCACERRRGRTLYDALIALYETYGCHKEAVQSYTLEGKTGAERIRTAMAALRTAPPAQVAGTRVVCTEDFLARTRTDAGGTAPILLPASDMLRFTLADGTWIVARPSGTEPKLKLYIGAAAADEAAVDARLGLLLADMDGRLRARLFEETGE